MGIKQLGGKIMNGFSNTMQGPVGFQVTITAPIGREFLIPGVCKFTVDPKGVDLVFFSDEPYRKVIDHLNKYGFTYVVAGSDPILSPYMDPETADVLVQDPTL